MKIKLNVPSKPGADKVSVGNFEAELKPNSIITVENRRFADHLIENFGLTETGKKSSGDDGDGDGGENQFGYPAGFPGRDALEAAKIPFETVKGLTLEQLVAVKGIGEKTAESILAFEPEETDGEETADDNGGEE